MELVFPPFRLDLAAERLWQGEREIRLRPKTFAVLRYLAERPGRLISTTELLKAVWSDVAVTDDMPRQCIRELRSALGDDARTPRLIETRPARGYRFVAPLVPLAHPAAGDRWGSAASESGRPLVGRRPELDRLGAALERVRRGERQVVFVGGEPGIGKTSLVEAFLSAVAPSKELWVKGECVEQYGAGEPYLPILTALERLGRGAGGEALVEALRRLGPAWLAQLPSVIEPIEHKALVDRLGASTSRGMLRELAAALETLSDERVLVIWLEDLHWADHSTLEAIAFLARRLERARLMLLGTYRPAELPADAPLARLTHELALHGRAREMSLGRLPAPAVAEYLAFRLAGTPVSAGLVHHVHRRTDGNPLFMVTVADDLVGRTLVVERGGEWALENVHAQRPDDVPDALRRLIEQHAQRLAPEDRRLLEAASVAGVDFSAAAVAAALDQDQSGVEERCAHLVRLGRFLAPSKPIDWPDGTTAAAYGFLHALHRDVFYEGIPAGQRRQLHGRIADRLEQAFAERAREAAAELAMHCERARDARRAAHYHRLAGEMALRRAANAEAIAHLSRGLKALQNVPAGGPRLRMELGLQLAVGPAWIVSRGYATTQVESTYARALELARRLRAPREVTRALRGLWNVHLLRADLGTARTLAAELLARAKRLRDPGPLAFAHAVLGETLFHAGELRAGRAHLMRSLALGRGRAGREHGSQRPRVAVYAGWALWSAGHPDQARRRCDEGVAEARALARPHNRAFALGYAGIVYQLCGDTSRVAELAEELSAVCRENDIPYWLSVAEVLGGWVLADRGRVAEGALAMRQGIEAYRQTGSVLGVTHFLTLLAKVHVDAGEVAPGRQAVEEALALALRTGDRCVEPDIHRVRGELLLRRPDDARAAAEGERSVRQAIEVARRRAARSPELRAATGLARLWDARGDRERARRLLAPLCRWFTEGADTADVRAARGLLAGLEGAARTPRTSRR